MDIIKNGLLGCMGVYCVGYFHYKGVSDVPSRQVVDNQGKLDKKATRPTVTAKTMPWFDAKMSRRKFLKLAGSGMAIVVVGGTVWPAFSNGVFSSGHGPAYEPWKDWKTESEEGAGPLSLVASAILAANAHNTLPWLFVVNPNKIDLFADTKRNTGTIDPYLREMYEGLGCALENLVLAAEAKDFRMI